MYIPSKLTDKYGVSLIKRNSKVSLCVAKKRGNEIEILKEVDKEFPFSNPLITSNAVKVFEFIVETNNYVQREVMKDY